MGDWESIFKTQGKFFNEIQEDMMNVIKFLKDEKSKNVLDLGCGTGRHTVLLAKAGFDVHATDISKEGLRLTRKWLNKENITASIIETSCYDTFPFKDDSFDAVISTQVIHHNYHEKINFCISEIERVLKSRGIIFITVTANRYKSRATQFETPAPRTYVPLDGIEKGLAHFIYNEDLIREDFKNFQIMDLHKDTTDHWCFSGRLKEICH